MKDNGHPLCTCSIAAQHVSRGASTVGCCVGTGWVVWLSSWQIPFLFTSAEEVKEEKWGDAVLYTTQCLGTGSVLVHPVQWPKATELVHSRMCSKKLTLASWTGLHGHHSGRRHYDGQRGSDTGHDLGLSISPPTSGLGALFPTLSSVGGRPGSENPNPIVSVQGERVLSPQSGVALDRRILTPL